MEEKYTQPVFSQYFSKYKYKALQDFYCVQNRTPRHQVLRDQTETEETPKNPRPIRGTEKENNPQKKTLRCKEEPLPQN